MSIVYNDNIQYPNLNPPKPCSFNINLFCSNTGHLAQGTLSFWSKAIILDSSEAGYHTFTLRAVPAQKKNGTVDLEHVALEGHTLCVYIYIDKWATDEIACLGNMPSANMVVPYRFSGFCMFWTLPSKQKHAIYIVGWFDVLHDREIAGERAKTSRVPLSFWQQRQMT